MAKQPSKHMIVVSSNKLDTPLDIEEKLQKAVSAMKKQQESKELPDLFLKTQYQTTANIVDQVMKSMLEEIVAILNGGGSTK